jgi:hypothetical protein
MFENMALGCRHVAQTMMAGDGTTMPVLTRPLCEGNIYCRHEPEDWKHKGRDDRCGCREPEEADQKIKSSEIWWTIVANGDKEIGEKIAEAMQASVMKG